MQYGGGAGLGSDPLNRHGTKGNTKNQNKTHACTVGIGQLLDVTLRLSMEATR